MGAIGHCVLCWELSYGYQLQNYEKDGGMWNYTLDPKFGNLTVGENIYEIKADGSDGISATTTLVINFEPAR